MLEKGMRKPILSQGVLLKKIPGRVLVQVLAEVGVRLSLVDNSTGGVRPGSVFVASDGAAEDGLVTVG